PGLRSCPYTTLFRSGVSGREHLLYPVVDLLDHGEQVAPGLAEVIELGGQEGVPLGERLELLQGQRVDLAQPVQLALRVGGPSLRSEEHTSELQSPDH